MKNFRTVQLQYAGILTDGSPEVVGVEGSYVDGTKFHMRVGYIVKAKTDEIERKVYSILANHRAIGVCTTGEENGVEVSRFFGNIDDLEVLRPA